MTPEVPPTKTVVPDPDAYVAAPLGSPVVTSVTRRRVISRDVETTEPVNDTNPWLWMLGILALLLVAVLAYLATRGNDTPTPATNPSPATTVIVQQPAAPPPAAPAPVIVQQPPNIIVQQPPAQQQPQQQASQPAPAAS